jgi:hypothetical protein
MQSSTLNEAKPMPTGDLHPFSEIDFSSRFCLAGTTLRDGKALKLTKVQPMSRRYDR